MERRIFESEAYTAQAVFQRIFFPFFDLGIFVVGYVDDPVHVVERGPVVVIMDGGRTHRPDMLNFHSTVALKGQ
jgi:hypothetical protein